MDRAGYRRWLILLTWGSIVQIVCGGGKLDIKFLTYGSNGKGSNGNCCESVSPVVGCGDPCDPFFYICLDRYGGTHLITQCSIYARQTGVFHDANAIYFTTSLAGVANPILITKPIIPNTFNIKIRVRDYDPTNDHDHIDDMMATVTVYPTYNGVRGAYKKVFIRNSPRAALFLDVRSYCDVYYYGNTCAKKCKPGELGNYKCNATGDKICLQGWTGDNCDEDIDECQLEQCKHGANCTNFPGKFTCNCTEDYKGTFCEEPKHECVINPCLNGGTCLGNETTEFACDCLPWWGGKLCDKPVNPCDVKPCQNDATCTANNESSSGFVCTCEFGWTGATCESTTTTTSTTTPTTTTVFIVSYGDPYHITLLGVIDDYNRPSLEDGLIRIINELGGVNERVYVKVNPQVVPIKHGLVTTYVEFHSGSEAGSIDSRFVDGIFQYHSDDVINSFLPLPLYRPGEGFIAERRQINWISSNWYVILIPILIAIIVASCIVAFVIIRRKKKKEKAAALFRCESNVDPPSPTNMAFENVLYHQTHRQRESDVLDGGDVTLTPDEKPGAGAGHETGAGADESNPYCEPVQYDTPSIQAECPGSGVSQYQNSNLATLDTRCEASANDYTDFNDLEGSKPKEENPYQELDDVIAQKLVLTVGLPEESDGDISIDTTDDEDDIDKIKASFKEQTDA